MSSGGVGNGVEVGPRRFVNAHARLSVPPESRHLEFRALEPETPRQKLNLRGIIPIRFWAFVEDEKLC